MKGGETSMKRLSLSGTRRALEPALRRVLHLYWRFARAMTLGVRALVIDEQGRVFLVKHSYVSGWHLPGGGVEAGETLSEALARELREEGNIEITAAPQHRLERPARPVEVGLFHVPTQADGFRLVKSRGFTFRMVLS